MGMTVTEKILSKACQENVRPGAIVNVPIDTLMVMDLGGVNVFRAFEMLGAKEIKIKDKVVFINDHGGVGHSLERANLIKSMKDLVTKYDMPNFYDVGRSGICHHVMVEDGWAKPCEVAVGADSHATTYGAVGAFGTSISMSEAGIAMATGKAWFSVPESIKIELTGTLPFGCSGKDVALELIRVLGCDEKAIYKALEFAGEGRKSLSMSDRMAICNMMCESGAKNAVFPVDEVTAEYTCCDLASFAGMEADPDAEYEDVITIDLDKLVPLVAVPHLTSDVHPAAEYAGTPLTQAFLGSCTSGRLDEFEVAARILRGKKIAKNMVMVAVPSSVKVYKQALELGYIQDLVEAGVSVESSSCAACAGAHTGVLPDGAICISTTNRNFKARMGSAKSSVYLASAATVSASALEGKIVDPRDYM